MGEGKIPHQKEEDTKMTKLEMLNEMFKGTQFESNIPDHLKKSKKKIETAYNYWKQDKGTKRMTSFLDAWLV